VAYQKNLLMTIVTVKDGRHYKRHFFGIPEASIYVYIYNYTYSLFLQYPNEGEQNGFGLGAGPGQCILPPR
jgi:hypothetical protein